MGRFAVVGAWVWVIACAGANQGSNSDPVNVPVQGTYTFTANLPDLQLRGRLRVTGSEILLEPASGTCRAMDSDSLAIHFTCNASGKYEQISIRINRDRPSERSTWSASYRVQRTRQVCAEYTVVSGRQVCARTHTEYYDTTEGHTGRLSVRRAS